jgi:MerR family transcriptional regulator, light-induced transcriptional regulator
LSRFDLTIGAFVARTGVAEPTLRIWERRYGFPEPRRTQSGHRRYSEAQADVVEQVLALRSSGLSLPAAIARAQTPPDPESVSLFSTLRAMRPELESRAVRKPVLIALSHAIEDEALARAEARLLFACFQRQSFYRSSQARWKELSAAARVAAVFADFEQINNPESGPAEIPISRRQQISREWAIILYGGRSSICMVARELASSNVEAATSARSFELLWTVDPEAVRGLARGCLAVMQGRLPELAAAAEEALAIDSTAVPSELVRLTTAVLNRTLSELS